MPVWAPHGLAQAFPLTLLSLLCWGSWSNTAKMADNRNVPFPHFYTDYAFAIFCSSIAWWIVLGSGEMGSFGDDGSLSGAQSVDHWRVFAGIASGTVFNVANVLMVYGINLAGLSVAFPLAIGTSLVVGTVLIYVVDPGQRPSSPAKLFAGVMCGFLAVICIAIADRLKRTTREALAQPINQSKSTSNTAFHAIICLVSGLLMGCWGPLSSYAQDKTSPGALNPYFAFVLFAGMTFFTSLKPSPIAIFLVWADDTGGNADYFSLTWTDHLLGWAGGFIWSVGTLSNLVAGSAAGLALSYAIGQAAPLAAMAWGVLYYREFAGAPGKAYAALILMVVLYIAAISIIASSK